MEKGRKHLKGKLIPKAGFVQSASQEDSYIRQPSDQHQWDTYEEQNNCIFEIGNKFRSEMNAIDAALHGKLFLDKWCTLEITSEIAQTQNSTPV